MAEGEPHRQPARLVPAVAHEEALAVGDLAALTGEVAVGGRMLEQERQGGGKAAAGLGLAKEHVDEGVGVLLPGEPRLQEGAGGIGPRHGHGRPRVDNDHSVARRPDDPPDQVILPPGQVHRLAVDALGLDRRVGADDDHDGVGTLGQGHRPLDAGLVLSGLVHDLNAIAQSPAQRLQR